MTMVLVLVAALAICGALLARVVLSLRRRADVERDLINGLARQIVTLDRKVEDLDVPLETLEPTTTTAPAEGEEAPTRQSYRRVSKRPRVCSNCGRRPPSPAKHWSGAWLCRVCVSRSRSKGAAR
jgi:hypothetical protein